MEHCEECIDSEGGATLGKHIGVWRRGISG